MKRIWNFIKEFWPSMITLGVILYATLNSSPLGDEVVLPIPYIDKWIHAIMMGGLVGAIAFDLQRHNKNEPNFLNKKIMWSIWLGVAIFGGIDELSQGLMDNGRGCEGLDYVADIIGATIAVIVAPPVIRKVLKIK